MFVSATTVVPDSIDSAHIYGPPALRGATMVGPGEHVVGFFIVRYMTFPLQTASGTLKLTFESGERYVLRTTNPVPEVKPDGQASGWANECSVWVEDGSGKAITGRVKVLLSLPPPAEIPIFIAH